jgi:hypothetical protein
MDKRVYEELVLDCEEVSTSNPQKTLMLKKKNKTYLKRCERDFLIIL